MRLFISGLLFLLPAFGDELNSPAPHVLITRTNDPYSVSSLELKCVLTAEPQKTPNCSVQHLLDAQLIVEVPVAYRTAKTWVDEATKTLGFEPETGQSSIEWVIELGRKAWSGSAPKASLLALESKLFRWNGE